MKKKKMKKKVIFLFWLLSSFVYGANSSSEVNNLKKISLSEVLDQGKQNVPEYFGEGAALFLEETEKEYLVTIKDSSFPNEWTLNKISKEEEIIEFLFMDVGRSPVKEIIILTKLNQTYKIYSYMFNEYLGYWGTMEILDDLLNLEIKKSKNIELTEIKEKLEKLPKLDYLSLSEVQSVIKKEYTGLDLITPPVIFSSEEGSIKRLKEGVYGKFYETEMGEELYAVFEGYSIYKSPFYIKDGKYQEGFLGKYHTSGRYKAGVKEGEWEYYDGVSETIEKYKAGYLEERILYDYDKITIESYKNGELEREERKNDTGEVIFYSNGISLKGIEKKGDKEAVYRMNPKESFWGYRLQKDSYDVVIYEKYSGLEEKIDTYEKGREILSIFYHDIAKSHSIKTAFILTKYEGKYKIYCYNLNIYTDLDPVTFIPYLSKNLNNYFKAFDFLDALTIKKRLESMKKEMGDDLLNIVNFNFLETSKGKFYEGIDFYSGEIIFKDKEKTIRYYESWGIFGEFYNGRLNYIYQGIRKPQRPYYSKEGKFTSVGSVTSRGYLQEGTYLNDKKNGFWRERGRNEDEELIKIFAQYYPNRNFKISKRMSLKKSDHQDYLFTEEFPPYLYYDMSGNYKDGKKQGRWKIKDYNENEKIVFYTDGKISKITDKKNETLEMKKEGKSKIGIKTVVEGLFWITAFIFSFNFSDFGWLGYFILLPTCWYFYIQYRKKYLYLMIGMYGFMLSVIRFYIVSEPIKTSRIALLFLSALALFIPVITIVNVLWVLYLLIKKLVNRGVASDEQRFKN